jgi:hypothetical protein
MANQPKKMGKWEFASNTCKILITSGYAIPLILGIVFVVWSWVVFGGMESTDKKDSFLAILNAKWLAWLGWVLLLPVLLSFRYVLRFQRNLYERQLADQRKTIDQLTAPKTPNFLSNNP